MMRWVWKCSMFSMITSRISSIGFWVSGLTLVLNIHDSTTILTISTVVDILDSAIRKSNFIFSLDVSIAVSFSGLSEVSVVMIIMNSILKVEWIRLLITIALIMSIGISMRSMVFNRVVNSSVLGWSSSLSGGMSGSRDSIMRSMVGLDRSWSSTMSSMVRFWSRSSSIVGGVVNTLRDNTGDNRSCNYIVLAIDTNNIVDSGWSKSTRRILSATSSSEGSSISREKGILVSLSSLSGTSSLTRNSMGGFG